MLMHRRSEKKLAAGRSLSGRAQIALYPAPHLFGVVTWGCSASRWLTRALNAHPEVFCVHELNAEIAALGGTERMDGSEYLELLGVQGSGYAAAGDVHGITRAGALSAQDALGDRTRFAVLVREPEARVLSQRALFRVCREFPVWDISYVDSLVGERGIALPDFSYQSRLMVHAANMLNAITEEAAVRPIYRMEDLTSSPPEFGEFLGYLTQESVDPTPEWCQAATQMPPLNGHRSARADTLAEWERDIVRRVVSDEAWAFYADLGYDIPDWVESAARAEAGAPSVAADGRRSVTPGMAA
jgi:hypothetical protein